MTKLKATTKTTTASANVITKYFNFVFVVVIVLLFSHYANGTPMLYKKNLQQKYEADLVPVSSTVIPLTVLEVSYGLGGKPSEEYKKAYLKKLRKKVMHHDDTSIEENPDTLITINKKHNDASKAKVKDIPNN